MVETLYMQRSGHLVMSEIHNTGSREITDVELQVTFPLTFHGIDKFQLLAQKLHPVVQNRLFQFGFLLPQPRRNFGYLSPIETRFAIQTGLQGT